MLTLVVPLIVFLYERWYFYKHKELYIHGNELMSHMQTKATSVAMTNKRMAVIIEINFPPFLLNSYLMEYNVIILYRQ